MAQQPALHLMVVSSNSAVPMPSPTSCSPCGAARRGGGGEPTDRTELCFETTLVEQAFAFVGRGKVSKALSVEHGIS
jgi:hypothetical protein